ncbi:MAG: TIGR00341 family protein [Halothiobacillus sp. 20-53-49]|nr:MAG: TIGR00341 family protein [Halothiobacillus sp. 20-53-49]HUM99742.1 TIGR00341 family protein [Halothiobacillus sp.]
MSLKVLEIIAPRSETDAIEAVTAAPEIVDWWRTPPLEDERFSTHIMVTPEHVQTTLDGLQKILDRCAGARIIIHSIETTLPQIEAKTPAEDQKPSHDASLSREELFEAVDRSGRITQTYLLLTALSAIVAAIGMIENSVAAVIGAMVIAPLLGPNLALALGTTLGDIDLSRRAILANLAGLGLAIGLAFIISFLVEPHTSAQLLERTEISYGALILALASGAAAVLSLSTGAAAGLVGVMVAVALMPPAVALGLFLGWGDTTHAAQTALLLLINVTAINLSAKLVLVLRGVSPRRWPEKSRAKQSSRWSFAFWGISFFITIALIYLAKH